MQIPIHTIRKKPKPILEMRSIQLYSTGSRGKVFTNVFYRAMNHNFGVEIRLRNSTNKEVEVKVGGCIYDSDGNTVKYFKDNLRLAPNREVMRDYFVGDKEFSEMKNGDYKVQFWLNDKKVQKEFFKILYK